MELVLLWYETQSSILVLSNNKSNNERMTLLYTRLVNSIASSPNGVWRTEGCSCWIAAHICINEMGRFRAYVFF